jgi:hypothetical protein
MKTILMIIILGLAIAPAASGQNGKSIPADSKSKYEQDLKKLYPSYSELEYERDYVFSINDAEGKKLGTLFLETIQDSDREFGYAGTIEVGLAVGTDNKVAGFVTGKHVETPAYLIRVKRALAKSWNNLELKDVPEHKVDAVTSATYTSAAIVVGVKKLAKEHLKSDTPIIVTKPQSARKRDNKELEEQNAKIEQIVTEYRKNPDEKTKAELKALLQKQQETEIAELTKRVNMLERIVTGSQAILKQWTTRRAEELDLRVTAALQGREAAQALAKEKGLIYFSHPRHGAAAADKELDEAVKKCKENPDEANQKALRQLVEERFDAQLEGIPSHNENQERSYKANKERLEKMTANKEQDLEQRLNALIK